MKKWLLGAALSVLLCAAQPAYALEEGSYVRVIGGSGADRLDEMFVCGDGRILAAGVTSSSDGWLSDRTKTTKGAWLTCIDEAGERAWNFVSRQSNNDRMLAPVVHADGTITALMRADGHEYNQIELIRLASDGQQIDRRTLMKLSQEEAHCMLEGPKAFGAGYVVDQYPHTGPRVPTYVWFDFDGNQLKTSMGEWEGSLMAISGRHVIEAHDGEYWLCGIETQGENRRICPIPDGKKSGAVYYSLISLDDGGAMACGITGGADACAGLLTRWDAAGNTLAQIRIPGYSLDEAFLCDDGYIVTGYKGGTQHAVLRLDAQGGILDTQEIRGSSNQWGKGVDMLPDGRLAVITTIETGITQQNTVDMDGLLTVIDGL